MLTVDYMFDSFRITDEEYAELDNKFGDLCHFVAWDLKRKNSKNNFTDEIEDIAQDLKWSLSKACVYTKRQRYIEASLGVVKKHVKDPYLKLIVKELETLWANRTRHGANKQKFGQYQEGILETLVHIYVPKDEQPNRSSKLEIDKKFTTYCKSIVWNCSKNLGKKITRDRRIRSGLVSLSEWSFLGGESGL